ncbi:MAG: glycosyltransferase family 2 protein [Bacteroidetes bacterium]|nr:glycosyltransferase family 2 protein [Bacteroidota bacterium]MDA1121651.1 glycosyltransferase family 2 protein [Bacteroidota bacterium]
MNNPIIKVIIPALNEENAIGKVIEELPGGMLAEVVVVDNGSQDQTFQKAIDKGATAIREPRRGYGQACLTGIKHVSEQEPKPDILVFIDGDHSDFPENIIDLVNPIIRGEADMVIGSRALGNKEDGSMTFPQIFGNWLATTLLRLFYGAKFTDLGPFRAIRYESLMQLGMIDTNYGWTVEMQLKAAKYKLRYIEIPVDYRRRIGFSKISGTISGTIMAGYKIIWTIIRYL